MFNNPGAGCAGPTNFLFVQYSCEQSLEDQEAKYGYLCLATATICLVSLLYIIALQYLNKNGKIQQLEWDISTVTAGDYTVEFDISADSYNDWYNNNYKSYYGDYGQGYSPALSLKRHMIEQIEQAIKVDISNRQQTGQLGL